MKVRVSERVCALACSTFPVSVHEKQEARAQEHAKQAFYTQKQNREEEHAKQAFERFDAFLKSVAPNEDKDAK